MRSLFYHGPIHKGVGKRWGNGKGYGQQHRWDRSAAGYGADERPTCTWSASGRTTSRSRLGRSIPMLLITHHVKLCEILRAYDTFSRAADAKAL